MKHNPKDRWKIPKVLTGEQCSLHLNKIITPCHLNPFFTHGHGAPGLEQLSLPPRNAPEGLKLSTDPDGLSSPPNINQLIGRFMDSFQLSISPGLLPDCWRSTRPLHL